MDGSTKHQGYNTVDQPTINVVLVSNQTLTIALSHHKTDVLFTVVTNPSFKFVLSNDFEIN